MFTVTTITRSECPEIVQGKLTALLREYLIDYFHICSDGQVLYFTGYDGEGEDDEDGIILVSLASVGLSLVKNPLLDGRFILV